MKYVSFAIPCYNSAEYMEKAIESILVAGEDVEILVVNDGSTDATSEIAKQYAAKYPTIVKAIDKENGGHGDAVNTGLQYATGFYFKVVDSDDWVEEEALKKMMELIHKLVDNGQSVDMLLSNYVYEKVGARHKKVIRYPNIPRDRIINWNDIKKFRISDYILMHSVMYRTQLLKECGLQLPKHTFYVDNIYVYYPLPYVKTIYYLDVNLYRYFIGRDGQSVNEKNMIKRIDQQFFITKTMTDMYVFDDIENLMLRDYMRHYLNIMLAVSGIIAIRSKNEENLVKKSAMWDYLKQTDEVTYRKLRRSFLGMGLNLPGKVGRGIATAGYFIASKLFGFN